MVFGIFEWFFGLLGTLCVIFALVSILSVLIPFLLLEWAKPQNLKAKYNAEWAVVTGASSGIGRAITERLAEQGVNVVMVALDDNVFADVHVKLTKQFPKVQLRKVGVDLSQEGYMDVLKNNTNDITPNLIFNNAGYIVMAFFANTTVDRQMRNIEVNVMASVKITHHFLNKLIEKKTKGAFFYTSSPAALFPNSCSALYGSTKSFLTSFASSIAAEVKEHGIDVCVIHPSPVDTGFYASEAVQNSSTMMFFKKAAVSPTVIADALFASIGRAVVRDQGFVTLGLHLASRLIDFNVVALLGVYTLGMSGDYKKLKESEAKAKKTN